MILGYHVIISAYGFWLPNEERGSWSDFVRNWELYLHFGPATKVDTTRSVAWKPFSRDRRRIARNSLMYPHVEFDGRQAQAIGLAFKHQVEKSDFKILAGAILPSHTHLVIGRHHYFVEQVVNLLKGAATRELISQHLHPLQHFCDPRGKVPSPWAVGLWKVFLDSHDDVRRAVRYVENNPLKERKSRQHWSFVRCPNWARQPAPPGRR